MQSTDPGQRDLSILKKRDVSDLSGIRESDIKKPPIEDQEEDMPFERRATVLDKVIDILEDMKEDKDDGLPNLQKSKSIPKPDVSEYESQLLITQEDNDEIFDDFI